MSMPKVAHPPETFVDIALPIAADLIFMRKMSKTIHGTRELIVLELEQCRTKRTFLFASFRALVLSSCLFCYYF